MIANDDETPSEIAKRNGWEVTALLKANKHIYHLRAGARLYEGTRLFEPIEEESEEESESISCFQTCKNLRKFNLFLLCDIETILNTLTLSEKIQLCSGASAWRTPSIPSKKIPILKVSDGPNGVRGDGRKPSTSFPVGICMSSTFNNKLIHKVGQIIAAEAKQKDVDVVLGPTINLHRSPLGGRNFECYSCQCSGLQTPDIFYRLCSALIFVLHH